jgi:hypothetical protein
MCPHINFSFDIKQKAREDLAKPRGVHHVLKCGKLLPEIDVEFSKRPDQEF